MCEQCLAETVDVVENVLPGFVLQRASKDGGRLKAGDYCLVEHNDPSFFFSVTPEKEPKEPEIEDEAYSKAWWEWANKASEFEQQLGASDPDLKSAYRLVAASYKAGYTDEDGRFAFWLFNFLAGKL